ncbi:MAG: hypothetical protein A2806_03935 [Candidatus Terrybacteria bacterium RIFCSPHIGHO2_01_FULL_48_17]|uniref:Uncharacterized protein n=1 Tax=Candidatus Terrybacteria bacterium RIFCSPHIGHO2_01_FULL_48_17 TaxID=1802362 RepID=A0A1G2PKH4_9BACT|nr:MAG: hypothetical protein A2806_03935 [Candidatus Terrybacteria bacterium RIFCSPHIGHO2_01_FULL_48_17]OHA53300.1 MAG: hypothetical protein A3A30_03925 [Candidatus Terrybacteria bacterium RIFCSPLOWO2_01_FULL_48_14]
MEEPRCDGVVLEYYDPVQHKFRSRLIWFKADPLLGRNQLKLALVAIKIHGLNLAAIHFINGHATFSAAYRGPSNFEGRKMLDQYLPEDIASEFAEYSPPD